VAADLDDWLRLTRLPGIGGEAQRALLKAFGLPAAVFEATAAQLQSAVGEQIARKVLAGDDAEALAAALATLHDWLAQPGHSVLTLADADYPQALLETADPPTLLYVNGRRELLRRPMLAMVGSRNATAQGERDAEAFSRNLAGAGLTVISGLALGIDAAAHRGAVDTPAGTVAVIGTGIDRIYPARNAELARQIAERGAIISEFPLGTPALAANFPRRNRLIAGLAKGTLVVEAAPRSGSLITARLAAEAGREVFAIPGSIHSPQSRGCHLLIRQGAKLVETAQDILEELRWNSPAFAMTEPSDTTVDAGGTATGQSAHAEQVLTALGHTPCDIDTLTQNTGLTAAELLVILLPMELAGRVAQLPGGRYQRLSEH
jgi:DNA processing protein